jgi:hypothetical protein
MKLYGAVILLSLALTSAAFLKGKNSGKHRRIEPSKSSSEDSGAKDESFLSSANLIPNTDPPFLQEPVGAGGEAEVEARATISSISIEVTPLRLDPRLLDLVPLLKGTTSTMSAEGKVHSTDCDSVGLWFVS